MGARRVVPALDGLRAVAAGAVLLTHVAFRTGQTQAGAGGAVLARFDAGVAVFFVLSGFLLYPATRPLGRYALRRAARILPAYWVLLAAVTVAGSVPAAYWWLGQGYGTDPLTGPLTRLTGIPGSPPDLRDPPSGCRFNPRCPYCVPEQSTLYLRQTTERPLLRTVEPGHRVACHLVEGSAE